MTDLGVTRIVAKAGLEGTSDGPPTPTTWAPVDLTAALAGDDLPPAALFKRTDGNRLLYEGRVHWFLGESESCKSWAWQHVAADVVAKGGDVLVVDFEDDERGVVARLRSLGLSVQAIAEHLVYLRPDEALYDRHGNPTPGAVELADVLTARTYRLAVIDGVTEAMTTEGLALGENTDVARWSRMLPKRIADLGPAVVVVDHVVKDRESQGRYAIGGQHKLAGLTGAAYKFVTLRPLARAKRGEPVDGTVAITVTKDRPGHVRAFAAEGKVGTLTITAWPDGGVTCRLVPPGEEMPDSHLVQRIREYLDTYDGSSVRAIEAAVEGKAVALRGATSWLVDSGQVRVERKGNAHLHFLTDVGRDALKAGTR